ncbi:MAG: glutamate--tRNA ligase, partial [Caldisericaceae bacterium]
APAIFDIDKLKWMNHKYIENLSPEEIYKKCKEIGLSLADKPDDWWIDFIGVVKEHLDTLSDVLAISSPLLQKYEVSESVFGQILSYSPLELFKTFRNAIYNVSEWSADSVLQAIRDTGKALKIKGKNLYFPLRLAVTGSEQGLEVHEFIYLIGREAAIERLDDITRRLSNA